MEKFFLIDASGLIFKSYFALSYLGTEENPLSVVYGFFRIFFKLLQQQPAYLLLAWDLPSPTQRKEFDSTYKANRPEAPEDLVKQIKLLREIVSKLEIPNLAVPGYEADDIIYSVAKIFGNINPDINFYFVTSDKDMKQAISQNISLFDSTKMNNYTLEDFLQEYEFPPSNFVDYLSLIGDSIDNIPGVKGIGPKTAKKLIKEFGSIENIYKNLEKVDEKVREKLKGQESLLQHNKKLIQLLKIKEIEQMNLEDFRYQPDFDKLRKVLVEEMNFKSMEKVLEKLEKQYKMPKQKSLF